MPKGIVLMQLKHFKRRRFFWVLFRSMAVTGQKMDKIIKQKMLIILFIDN